MNSIRFMLYAVLAAVPTTGLILSGVTSRLKQVAVDGDPAKLGDALRKLTAAKLDDKPDELTNKGSR